MPTPVICCDCGCQVSFIATCRESSEVGIAGDLYTVTVAGVGSATLATGSFVIVPGPGTYSYTVSRGTKSTTGTFVADCAGPLVVGVSLFDIGYPLDVYIQGCGHVLEGITFTYTDGQNVLTGVTGPGGWSTTVYTHLYLPIPPPGPYHTFTKTLIIPPQCGFAGGTFTEDEIFICAEGASISATLTPATGYACHCGRYFPVATVPKTLACPYGTRTLTWCDLTGVGGGNGWSACFTWNHAGTDYPVLAQAFCDQIAFLVWTSPPHACDPCNASQTGSYGTWGGNATTFSPDTCANGGAYTNTGTLPDPGVFGLFFQLPGPWSIT